MTESAVAVDDPPDTAPRPGFVARSRTAWRSSDREVPPAWQLDDVGFGVRETLTDLAVLLGGIAAVLLGWLQPWKHDLRVPLGYINDSLPVNMQIQSIIETGWFQRNDRLGAPFGQNLYDYPFGADNGNFLIIRAMTFASNDSHLLFNAFYVLGFFTVAVAAYFVALRLGTNRLMAITIAFVYAIAPYHFLRIGHTLLAHYAVVPLAILLAARVAGGQSFPLRKHRWGAVAGWAVICVMVGSFGAYYAIFGLLTIAMFAAFSAIANRSRQPLVAMVPIGGLIALSLIANLSGSLLFRLRNGVNDDAVLRIPLELDLYSFRLIQALTPPPGTRLPGFDGATSVLDEGSPSEPSMYFGAVGAVTLLAMLAWVLKRVVTRHDGDGPTSEPLMAALVAATITWIFVASAGGLNWLLLLVGVNQLRGWGRVSILMLFVVLLWGGRWLGSTLERRSTSVSIQAAVVAALAFVAVVDQVGAAPPPNEWAADFEVDQNFFAAVDDRLGGADSMVGQLPAIRFPEGGFTHAAGPYDGLRPFLHIDDVRFGFGGMRGREAEWQQQLNTLDIQHQLDAMIATGHDAIIYLLPAYADGGVALIAELDSLGVDDFIASVDGTWLFIELDESMTGLTAQQQDALAEALFAGIDQDVTATKSS